MAKPKDYKTLRDQWYKKLEKAGFEDIEDVKTDMLKSWSSKFTRVDKDTHRTRAQNSLVERKAKQRYYQLATYFLNDYAFESNLDKIIWEYHTEGISVRDISRLLKKAKVLDITGAGIHKGYIKRLRSIMRKMYIND